MSGLDFFGDDSRRRHKSLLLDSILSRTSGEISAKDVTSFDELIELATRFALLPRLVSRLDVQSVDREFLATVNAKSVDSAARASARAAEAFVLTTVLSRIGVPHVFLKGAGLAAHAVATVPGDRHTDDIDLIAPVDARASVLGAIADLGYQADLDSELPSVGGGTVAEQDFTTSSHAEMGLISPRGVRLDLHWFVPDAGTTNFADVLERAVFAGPEGGQIPVPDPALLLAQICDHVVLHHRARPAYLPRHLADLVDLIDTFGPGLWSEAAELGHSGSLRFSKLLLDLAQTGKLPSAVLFPPRSVQASLEASAELLDVLGRAGRDIRADPKRLVRKLIPSREYVANSYGIAPDDPKIPLCYLHRLVTLRFLFRPLRG